MNTRVINQIGTGTWGFLNLIGGLNTPFANCFAKIESFRKTAWDKFERNCIQALEIESRLVHAQKDHLRLVDSVYRIF